ncbi:MAG: hypothetical protein ACRDIV_00655, partial [Ktedonobacteraceae bacterium]
LGGMGMGPPHNVGTPLVGVRRAGLAITVISCYNSRKSQGIECELLRYARDAAADTVFVNHA